MMSSRFAICSRIAPAMPSWSSTPVMATSSHARVRLSSWSNEMTKTWTEIGYLFQYHPTGMADSTSECPFSIKRISAVGHSPDDNNYDKFTERLFDLPNNLPHSPNSSFRYPLPSSWEGLGSERITSQRMCRWELTLLTPWIISLIGLALRIQWEFTRWPFVWQNAQNCS